MVHAYRLSDRCYARFANGRASVKALIRWTGSRCPEALPVDLKPPLRCSQCGTLGEVEVRLVRRRYRVAGREAGKRNDARRQTSKRLGTRPFLFNA